MEEAYKAIMDHISVTEAMRSRILTNIQHTDFHAKPAAVLPFPARRMAVAAACLALLVVGAVIATALPWDILWRYFSWSNQTLAMMVLWTGAVFLFRFGYPPVCCFMAALPATFMSAVSMTYILQAPEGFQLSTSIAYPVGVIFAAACLVLFVVQTYVRNRDSAGTAEVRA